MFSSLYSMLPESKSYLQKEGWNDQQAGLLVMGCFVGGFFGIQAVSRLLHQHIPSHVVDCDHTHDGTERKDASCNHGRRHSRVSRARRQLSRPRSSQGAANAGNGDLHPIESTPLLDSERHVQSSGSLERHASARGDEMSQRQTTPLVATRGRATTSNLEVGLRRQSMYAVQKRVMSFVKDTKCDCSELGSCYGYTDPCGQECFKHLSSRSQSGSAPQPRSIIRTTTGPFYPQNGSPLHGGHDHGHEHEHEHEHDHERGSDRAVSPRYRTNRAVSREPLLPPPSEVDEDTELDDHDSCCSSEAADPETQHHHHVPANAFLSIGLQTSIAIALHKFPEGFITFATNHANPALGFNVFMALFVHNISEGFAMCLPLYMALGSRWRAMVWSAVLGGLSQPMGAGVAALWFKLAKRNNITPNAVVYGCLFAVTSGIMVSVALQLFVEGLSLNHNRNICIFFGFLGMAMLGFSNALFAAH